MGLTSIEWSDYTHNLWWGCQEVGDPHAENCIDPACEGCYARVRAENPFWWGRTTMFPVWGQDVGRRFFREEHYLEPLKWNAAAEKAGKPARVFCMSMGDWAEGRPDQRPFLDRHLYPLIPATPWLIWLLLTKRPKIARHIVPQEWQRHGWPKNAWPGTTAVTQKWWDLRVPQLMEIPAERQFVSVEPQAERIDMRGLRPSWVINGGKSGAKAPPMHPALPRSLRDQAVAAGLSYHFKQWGEWAPCGDDCRTDRACRRINERGLDVTHDMGSWRESDVVMRRVGKKAAGRLLDGREWNEIPEWKGAVAA